ncbi:MAG: BREX-1 system adenine-specific DNA-methyltransferase PglX [Thiomicrospira sp.]|jgi:type II restriction/modification system DNA methylase subunit YeeA|nr:BREX-1 system adenine-specific DNA-methyltransferase PglX [Thiomicrospira sp.]
MSENVNEILRAAGAEGAQVKAVDYLFHASAEDFKKIPGSPIAYWISINTQKAFIENKKLSDVLHPKAGLATGDNNIFQRIWFEVALSNIKFDCIDNNDSRKSPEKWYPCHSGGDFRKWYGNQEVIVNWQFDGKEIRGFKHADGRQKSRPQNTQFFFKEGLTWTKLSSGNFAARYRPKGFVFDDTGRSAFSEHDDESHIVTLGAVDSCCGTFFLKILNPSMSFTSGDVANVPMPKNTSIDTKVKELINQHRIDWNTYETSWDFTSNPLIQLHAENPSQTLAENYQAWWDSNQATIAEMQRLEEENNRLFIDAYGLQDELTPDVPLEEITLTVNPKYRYGGNASDAELAARFQSDTVCELISYAIGCMMGRYSLDRPGLVYAHAGNVGFADLVNEGAYQTFAADEDGIIPLTDQEWFADDATHRLVQFVKTLWGEASLSANLAFMAQSLSLHALKPKASESSLDVLRRYLSSQFFKDHCRTYKKRPIYWLFSSGKQKAFECLVYLHRYNESTLARMRTEYVVPLIGKLHSEAENLQRLADNAESTAQANKAKKALADLAKKQQELSAFDDSLKHFADQRITLDLDDGVKVNYAKFGELLADSKAITGK